MIFITDEQELNFNKGISALYFYADWLKFHKKMMIMIEKIELTHPDIKFYGIDTDDFPQLVTSRFKVSSVPAVIITVDEGKEVKRIIGMPLTSAFKKLFNDIYSLYGENNGKKR